jgi:hypothetical protein
VGCEVGFTAGITQLANGEQGLAAEGRQQVCNLGSGREVRDVEIGQKVLAPGIADPARLGQRLAQ